MNDTTATRRAFAPSPTLLICVIASLIAAAGLFLPSRSSGEADNQAADAGGDGIEIVGFDYAGDLAVEPGQRISIVNSDGVPHTITAIDDSFDSGVIDGGASGSFVAPEADGEVIVICTIHPSMRGVLTVSS